VTNLPESTGTVAPLPPAPACFYALRALEEPGIGKKGKKACWNRVDVMAVLFAGKDDWKVLSIDRRVSAETVSK
jgi:hypothetical protein